MDLISSHPFWPIKSGLIEVYPTLHENVTCDVAVLGAGISGALIAERLSREGLNVVVIDRREVAGGSTSASTALLQYEIDTPLTELSEMTNRRDAERAYMLCHDSIDTIERLAKKLRIECDFERKKSVYLASQADDAPLLQKECKARRRAGIKVDYMDKSEIESKFSFSREAALVSKQAAQLDCYRFTHALLHHAKKCGARIFDRTIMEKHESVNGGVRLTTDKGHVVQCRHAIFASGYESQNYLPKKIVNLKSTFALVSEPLKKFPGWWKQCLIWETARPYLYMRTTVDGRALIGGDDEPFRDPERRDRMIGKKARGIAKRFTEMFPKIELDIAYQWAGTFGETKDGLAYIGTVRQIPGCHFILGFGGNGITYSVIAADLIRDALFQKRNDDIRLFRFDR